MSHFDYERSREVAGEPFYAIIMGAMRSADTDNLEKLKNAFPETWKELKSRYCAPAGCLSYIEFQREYGDDNVTPELFEKMAESKT